jgi:hypothetical protein
MNTLGVVYASGLATQKPDSRDVMTRIVTISAMDTEKTPP